MLPPEDSIVDFENPSTKEVVPVRTAADTSKYQVFNDLMHDPTFNGGM